MNTPSAPLPPLALIAGPTASGKSALALALAERVGGTIVNADASQVYADLATLTARPTAAEVARAPHRLFGHVDGADTGYSAARWAADARAAIDAVHAAGGVPVLVGGTGLYLRTLLDGIAPVPPIDPDIRARVRAAPVAANHAALARLDPAAAARLAPADTTRVARALEVLLATGRPLAAWQAERSGGIGARVHLVATILMPDRAWLADRCDARAAAMLDGGARAEVAALVARADVPPDAPVRRAIGVAAVAGWIAGTHDRAAALASLRHDTRRYAKRQRTWFANQPPPDWMRVTDGAITPADIATKLRRI